MTPWPAPGPDSETLRSKDWVTGLSSSFVLDRLIAECGTKAPGVLKGYIVLKKISRYVKLFDIKCIVIQFCLFVTELYLMVGVKYTK